jgi:hypothetical protein
MPRVHVPHHPVAAMIWLLTVGLFVSLGDLTHQYATQKS